MRRLSILSTLGLLAFLVPGEEVSTNYYFSVPNTRDLRGVVIGDPPAYGVMRGEDVAWLWEAACERAALAGRTWTAPKAGIDKARIKPLDVFHGLTFGSGENRYLLASGTNDFIQGARTLPGNDQPPHVEVLTTVTTNYPERIWVDDGTIWGGDWVYNKTTAVQVVTMPMTNGTTSVYSNTWEVTKPHVVTTVTTNRTAFSPLDMVFADGVARWYGDAPRGIYILPRYAYVADCYRHLAGMNLLIERVVNVTPFEGPVTYWHWNSSDDTYVIDPDYCYTNQTDLVGILVEAGSGGRYGTASGNGLLTFPTSFDWDVVHTGGVSRIEYADLYAYMYAWADWQDDGGRWQTVGGHYAKLLGRAEETSPRNGKVCFAANVDGPSVAMQGADALGLPTYAGWTDWKNGECFYDVDFILVFHMRPGASLSAWNQW